MTNSADPDQLASQEDLHCLLRQGMSCSAREGLKLIRRQLQTANPRHDKIAVIAHSNNEDSDESADPHTLDKTYPVRWRKW